jgi:tetratricopeptide (TPR) repeat protein
MGFADAPARKEKLAQRAVQILMKSRRYADALTILEKLPGANRKIAAECYEETGQQGKAAQVYLDLGDKEKALKCYRSAPDFAAALALVRQLEGHAAQPSLEWLAELDGLLHKRPDNFNRVMTTPEKKLLESMLERGLGVQRKKPAPKPKTAPGAKSNPPVKKAAPKKPLVKKVAKPKIPRRLPPDEKYF